MSRFVETVIRFFFQTVLYKGFSVNACIMLRCSISKYFSSFNEQSIGKCDAMTAHTFTLCGYCVYHSIAQWEFSGTQYLQFCLFNVPFKKKVASLKKSHCHGNCALLLSLSIINLQNYCLRLRSTRYNFW